MNSKHLSLKAFTWTIAVFAALSANAGNSSGGGGVGFLCDESDGPHAYLADTYELRKTGQLDRYVGVPDFSKAVEVIDRKFPQRLFPHPFKRGENVTFGFMLAHIHNGLHFEEYGTDPLLHHDDNIGEDLIPPGCRKIQLAWQDLSTGIVQVRKQTLPGINGADWFYLKIHESLIALRKRPGLDTTPIRAKVGEIAKILSDPTNFALEVLQEMAVPYRHREIVPKDKQTRYRTLYYAPRELTCVPTWTGRRSWFRKTNFAHPRRIHFTRVSGEGRVGQENVYKIIPSYGDDHGEKISWPLVETDFYTGSYNAFGDADGVGTFDLRGKFQPSPDVDLVFSINKYDSVTGEFLGDYDVDNANLPLVYEVDSGYGLRCHSSETPIFRHDERSSIH